MVETEAHGPGETEEPLYSLIVMIMRLSAAVILTKSPFPP